MCKCTRIFRNISLEKCSKISLVLNLSLILLNLVIIFFTFLCIIKDEKGIILKTEILSYINNIFFCVIMIMILSLIEYYRYKKYLIKSKIKASFSFISVCAFISAIKFMDVFDSITKINRYMLLFNVNKKTVYNDFAIQITKQIQNQKKYLIIILITFIIILVLNVIYIIALFNMNIIFLNINFNLAQNDDKISNVSTEVDVSNDNENNISIINFDKIKYKYYLSETIINKIEKEYKDKMTQTSM